MQAPRASQEDPKTMKTDDLTMLAAHDWDFPVPIAYGPGRLAEIGRRCIELGIRNPLIVTDRGSRDLPFIGQLKSSLENAGLSATVFSDISPNAGAARFSRGP
jgi:alcohol dehydrogenase class IV